LTFFLFAVMAADVYRLLPAGIVFFIVFLRSRVVAAREIKQKNIRDVFKSRKTQQRPPERFVL
jgi:hypothetical protein